MLTDWARDEKIISALNGGKAMSEISADFGICCGRVSQIAKKNGFMSVQRTPLIKRIFDRTVKPNGLDGCWIWQGCIHPTGYGLMGYKGRTLRVHRVSYMETMGSIGDGLVLDHLCRNRACANPAHLEPVTPKENTRRGISAQVNRANAAARTHCPNGHAYTVDNIHIPRDGRRRCRECIQMATVRNNRKKSNRSMSS